MFDYESMRIIWWLLLGILLIGFAIMDGFDLGSAILLPIVARNDMERRIVINTVGAVWEGNQVWLLLGAGAIFAAWPALYAAVFSGFYIAMFLVLLSLILRPVGFKYRSKMPQAAWRQNWDIALFIGGLVPSLVFGVAIGNLFCGVAFNFDQDLRFFSNISFFSLLNPFALLCGLVSVTMIALHGAVWLNLKSEGIVQTRAACLIPWLAIAFCLLFILAGLAIYYIDGYSVIGTQIKDGPSNPFNKGEVIKIAGGWFIAFSKTTWHWLAPMLAITGALLTIAVRKSPFIAFWLSALLPVGAIGTTGLALFPFLLPSTSNPAISLTVWDASSSHLTLQIMLGAVVVFLPIILCYTSWAYYVMRGRVNAQTISNDPHSY